MSAAAQLTKVFCDQFYLQIHSEIMEYKICGFFLAACFSRAWWKKPNHCF